LVITVQPHRHPGTEELYNLPKSWQLNGLLII
jgi:hypothetical protein